MQRGSTELGAVDSLRESSVVVRPVAPPLANAAATPRLGARGPAPSGAAAARLPAEVATMPPQPPLPPVVVPPAPPTVSPLAAALGAPPAAAAARQPAAWGQPQQPGLQAPTWGQHPPAAGPAPQQQLPGSFPLWGQKVQQAAYRDPPPPALQQPLPPGRFGWQRVNQSPTKQQPLPGATEAAAAAAAAAMAGKAAAVAAADSWTSSEGDPTAPPHWQQRPPEQSQPSTDARQQAAMQAPTAAAMARCGSSQQQLLEPREVRRPGGDSWAWGPAHSPLRVI